MQIIKSPFSVEKRELKKIHIDTDLAIVGGGLSGVCCAITAARQGLKIALIQDRPVLGGNASSEVRLWILGATSHMGNNNRWAREGGVIDEILLENLYRNPEGNPVLLDALLLEMVVKEKNITLLLNSSVFDLEKKGSDSIRMLRAFCSQNSTTYEIEAPLFCDASGDGVVGFMAGAAFRIGAEARSEFNEGMAPDKSTCKLLGHTIYFYSKDTGKPVQFIPPSFALKDIKEIPRFRDFKAHESGCKLWWLEWGGNLDTIHESESIKWELWNVVYGGWNYIKNSGRFPEAENLTLEWVGAIPGKRESRRFEGDYILSQKDIIDQIKHDDAVSYGGWAIDLHPSDGVYSKESPCTQWHSKGLYQIPYRCLYSRNISNLFLAGRIISASHVAFGSTRVMATCAHNAQAVGMAAALCHKFSIEPRALNQARLIKQLQQSLLGVGQFIPYLPHHDDRNLINDATITASSELILDDLPSSGQIRPLQHSCAMMIPLPKGRVPRIGFLLDVFKKTTLKVELRASANPENHTPDTILKTLDIALDKKEKQRVWLNFDHVFNNEGCAFFCLHANEDISFHLSEHRITGLLYISQKFDRKVAKSPAQEPPSDSGIERFEFWIPERRPNGKNAAIKIEPPLAIFGTEKLKNGFTRPTNQPNAWLAQLDDKLPTLFIKWPIIHRITRLEIAFDSDYDHPLESVLMGHPEQTIPFCISNFTVKDSADNILHIQSSNHHSLLKINFDKTILTNELKLEFSNPHPYLPAAVFEVRAFS